MYHEYALPMEAHMSNKSNGAMTIDEKLKMQRTKAYRLIQQQE